VKTIVLEKPGEFRLADTTPPGQPGPGEALVRVHRVGICGTDLHAFEGRQPFFSYPRILGHELGVEIVAVGPTDQEPGLSRGDLCSVEPYLTCGHCIACRRGKTNCCASLKCLGVHTDGGMRELITVPIPKLHKSDKLPLEHLALVETLCIGAHAVRRAAPEPQEVVLVIGAGPIGLAVIQSAQLYGAQVMVMEISQRRMQFCREQLGIEQFIDAREDVLSQFQAFLGLDMPTIVFDATGNARSMMNAFKYIAPGSKIVFVGLFQGDVTFHDPDFHRLEMTIMSSRNATREDFAWVIKMVEEGKINLAPWISQQASPEEMVTQFPNWLNPDYGVIKAVLTFA
jgi:2-desacetyl-2-hydroxyethyl bacteriochlorophyllide A dehydrogenase